MNISLLCLGKLIADSRSLARSLGLQKALPLTGDHTTRSRTCNSYRTVTFQTIKSHGSGSENVKADSNASAVQCSPEDFCAGMFSLKLKCIFDVTSWSDPSSKKWHTATYEMQTRHEAFVSSPKAASFELSISKSPPSNGLQVLIVLVNGIRTIGRRLFVCECNYSRLTESSTKPCGIVSQ